MNYFSPQNCKSPSESSFSREWSLCIIHTPIVTVRSGLLKMTTNHSARIAPHPPPWSLCFRASQRPLHALFFELLWGAVFSRAWLQSCQEYCLSMITIHLKVSVSSWKDSSHLNSFRQQGKESPPYLHPRLSSYVLFSEWIILCNCRPVFCGVGLVLFLHLDLFSVCQRSQTSVPCTLFTLYSMVFFFLKKKENWVCEPELFKKRKRKKKKIGFPAS